MKDVIIVGAGPGGASAARALARKGYEVALYEKRQEIGAPKRCAEGVSSIDFKTLGINPPKNCVRQEIDGAILYAPNGKELMLENKDSTGYVLERKLFDKWLCEEAVRAGAFVQAKTNITGVIKEKGKVCGVTGIFLDEPFEERCKVLIAADGIETKIARLAGMNTACNPMVTDSGVQFEMAGIKMSDPKKLHIFVGNKIAPRGYVWIFPKCKDVANVGIGIIGRSDIPAITYLRRFVENHPGLKNGSILEVNAGGIPVGGLLKKMTMDNFLVVGDAAHQVSPIHGGGIFEAQFAGSIAGEVVADALAKGDTSEKALEPYNRRWWEDRGEMLQRVEKLREVIENMSDDDFNFVADNLTAENIADLCAGKNMKVLAKLLIKRPGLMKYAKAMI